LLANPHLYQRGTVQGLSAATGVADPMTTDISAHLQVAEALLAAPVPDDLSEYSRALGLLRRLGQSSDVAPEQRAAATALADALAARALDNVRRMYGPLSLKAKPAKQDKRSA